MDVQLTLDGTSPPVDPFPDRVEFHEEIPKSATGKFDEQRLRSEFEHVRLEEAE